VRCVLKTLRTEAPQLWARNFFFPAPLEENPSQLRKVLIRASTVFRDIFEPPLEWVALRHMAEAFHSHIGSNCKAASVKVRSRGNYVICKKRRRLFFNTLTTAYHLPCGHCTNRSSPPAAIPLRSDRRGDALEDLWVDIIMTLGQLMEKPVEFGRNLRPKVRDQLKGRDFRDQPRMVKILAQGVPPDSCGLPMVIA
jgi:hypothetical protein